MAITYHAGRRIQGLEYTASTLTTSGFAQTWGKDPSNSQFEVSSGRINFLDNTSSSGDRTWLDLQSIIGSAVSTTKWILRFKFNFSTLTSGSYYYEFDAGLSDTTVNNMTNQNFIGVRVLPSGFNNLWRPRTTDGNSYPRGGSSADISQSFSTGTDYYVEIKRTSASNWSISLSTTDAYDGDIQDDSYTDAGSATGLRYFKFGDAVTNTGTGFTMQGVCDVLEFYNDTNTAVTASGDEKPTNVQVGSRWEETDTRKMHYYADVSTDGLKAYYKFDESSGNIINQATSVGSSDSLGTDADMTISGATYLQTGKIGNALSFDGSNDYGSLGSSLSQWNFFHGTGDWSINFWINYDEFVAEDRFFSNMDSTETRGINFAVGWSGNPDGQIGLSIKSDNGFMTNNGGINFPSDISGTGTWVMITLVADYSDTTNTYTVYLNGVAGSSVARAVAGSTGDSEYSLKLGCRGNAQDRFFDGLFDEMTIWQRVLTADEITSLYNSNSGRVISSGIFTQWKELGT